MLTVSVTLRYTNFIAPLAELVDALDLGSSALRCVGSSPTWGKLKKIDKSLNKSFNKKKFFVNAKKFFALFLIVSDCF